METVDIDVTTLVYGGDALGRLPNGRAVFVPFALPGERVRVRLVEEKRGHARAELLEVLQPSPERIQPRCIHFGYCGGCHYQHLSYESQLEAKREIVRDQLQRIGGLTSPDVRPTVPCPRPYYYRNHVQFSLTGVGKLAYHKLRSEEVFAVQECHLPEPALNEIWPQLDFKPEVDLEPEPGNQSELEPGPVPEIERISLRLGAGEEVMLALESQDPQAPDLSVEELPVSVVHLSPAGALVMAGSPALVIEVLGRPFQVSSGSFFQVNTPMAEKMVEHLLEVLPLASGQTVLDVYCGAGLFSAFLAPRVGRLIGIESDPSAAEDFVANLDEFDNVELYEAPAEDVLSQLPVRPDIMVVDPPRTGLHRRALDALLTLQPGVLAYVSCDPSTLARDARRLVEGGYRLSHVTPFDLFPQTFHIESISVWERV